MAQGVVETPHAQAEGVRNHHSFSETTHLLLSVLADPFFGQRYVHVLGRRKLCHTVQHAGGAAELNFFVEGLRFPDDSFPGLVSIHVSLLETLAEVGGSGEGGRGKAATARGYRDGE